MPLGTEPVGRDMAERILTFDLGTSACKVVLWDPGGTPLAVADEPIPTHYPQPDWAEQDPADWWRAAVTAARRCLAGQAIGNIVGIGLTSQRESIVPVDHTGRTLFPCILWMDRRSRDQSARLADGFGAEAIHQRTGVIPDPTFTATKLLWLREHEPDALTRARVLLQPRDYLYYRLTGEPATDLSLASRTMCFDIRAHRWWEEMLEAVGARADQFPPVFMAVEAPFPLGPDAATALGLPSGIPVALGGGDRPCEAVGGGVAGARAMDGTGTATSVSMTLPGVPERLHPAVPCSLHVIPGCALLETGISTTGSILRWFHDLLDPRGADYGGLAEEAAKLPPGAGGLLALPFFMGARSVRLNPDARGVLLGLTLGHGRGHIVRAIMEGVAFEMRACLRALARMGQAPTEIIALGGGARFDGWNRIKASVLGAPVVRPRHVEAASLGAMLVAARAVGLVEDLIQTARAVNPIDRTYDPDPMEAAAYAALAPLYEEAYDRLAPLFGPLAQVSAGTPPTH